MKELMYKIEEIFFKKLEAKTGWGKNEIKQTYRVSVSEAIDAVKNPKPEKKELF